MTICTFETKRLLGRQWSPQLTTNNQKDELAVAVAAMLTEPVTRPLPATWQGSYTIERAQEWVDERVDEGTLVLVVERSTDRLVGLVISTDVHEGEVHLGYIVAEDMWGRGIASQTVRVHGRFGRRNPR